MLAILDRPVPSVSSAAPARPPAPYVVSNICCPKCDGDVVFYPVLKRFACHTCPPGPIAIRGKVVAA